MSIKFYGASHIKQGRRTLIQQEQLDNQIIAVLKEDHPQSVRHIFYRMTDPRLLEPVEKSDRGYRHVQVRCVALRRSGKEITMALQIKFSVKNFNHLRDDAHIRIGPLSELLGCSRCTIFRKFKNGILPKPIRVLGHRGLSAGTVRAILGGRE
jgi:predicted DNA-binding transcriptional regulator AlpA